MGVRNDNGSLSITFTYDGKRRTEYLGLKQSRANEKIAKQLSDQVAAEITLGTFDYAKRFPNSRIVKAERVQAQSDNPTLAEFTAQWLEEVKPGLVSESWEGYGAQMRHATTHPIGQMRLRAIDDGTIKRFIADLQKKEIDDAGKTLSPRRINMVLTRLRTVFATAARRRDSKGRPLIGHDPMAFVDNMRQKKSEVDPFTLEEAKRLIFAAEPQFSRMLTVLLFTGMRPGEAIGLRWDDIDWDHNFIRIRRTAVRGAKIRAEAQTRLPKTPGSERDIEMAAAVRQALKAQRASTQLQGGHVFVAVMGAMLHLNNLRQRSWEQLLAKTKIRKRPLYQCRHTFARLMLESGDTPQHIAAMLGHTSTKMVFDIYGRWTRPPESSALTRLDMRILDEPARAAKEG